MRRFSLMTVWVSGAWRKLEAEGLTWRETVERAYLLALDPDVRWVTLYREDRAGLSFRAATVAGYEGRVWFSRTSSMGELCWRGEEPKDAVEITGRFEKPGDWCI